MRRTISGEDHETVTAMVRENEPEHPVFGLRQTAASVHVIITKY
jgi:hypothetical protein